MISLDVLCCWRGRGVIRCTETGASDSMRSLYMLQKKTNAHMLTVPTHTAADSYWTILSASIGDSYKYILYRHTPSGQSRVYRVTQLRTDDVHFRESTGTGPVVLKVVPVTGAAFGSQLTN